MKKIILITIVAGSIGYYFYQKSKSVVATTGTNGNSSGDETGTTTGDSLNDFFNNLITPVVPVTEQTTLLPGPDLNSATTNVIIPASTVTDNVNNSSTVVNTGDCNPPVLTRVSHNSNLQIFAEWKNDINSQIRSVTVEYKTSSTTNWMNGPESSVSPVIIGSISDFNKNITLKAGNTVMSIRLTGICKNGKITAYSNVLKYNLLSKTGSELG